MSGFQIMITPTRIRNARQTSAAREPIDAIMAPFSAKAIVTFEDVPLTKTARRTLNVHNPTDLPLCVRITRHIDPTLGLQSDWLIDGIEIPAHGCHSVQLEWTPASVISYRGTMQITDQRSFKKDVLFVMRSIDRSAKGAAPPATATAKRSTVTLHQKPVRVAKSPVAAKRKPSFSTATAKAKIHHPKHFPAYAAPPTSSMSAEILGTHNSHAMASSVAATSTSATVAGGKENIDSANPLDALLDDIKFTPDHDHHVVAAQRSQSQHLLQLHHQVADQRTPHHTAAVPLWALDTPQDGVVPTAAAVPAAVASAAAAAFSPSVFSTARRSVSPHDSEMLRRKLFAESVAAAGQTPAHSPFICPAGQQFNFKMSPDKVYPLLSTTPRRSTGPDGLSPRQLGDMLTPAVDSVVSPSRQRSGSPGFGQRLYVTSPLRGAAGGLSPVSPAAGRLVGGPGLSMIREEGATGRLSSAMSPRPAATSGDEHSITSASQEALLNGVGQRTYICANRSSVHDDHSTATAGSATSAASPQYTSAQNLAGGGTPLSKNFASMQNLNQRQPAATADRNALLLWSSAQGSMPNLTDMAQVRPIENNRYFYQASVGGGGGGIGCPAPPVPLQPMRSTASAASVTAAAAHASRAQSHPMYAVAAPHSVHDLNFRETEIAAQSSRLNLTMSTSLVSVAAGPPYSHARTFVVDKSPLAAATTATAVAPTHTHRTFVVDRPMSLAETAAVQRHSPQTFAMPAQRPQQRTAVQAAAAASAAGAAAGRTSTGAMPKHRRTVSQTTPSKAGAPRLMRTSPTPPRRSVGGHISSSTSNLHKRVRDETADQSMRRSFKHSPPKRLRQQQHETGSPMRTAKSTSSLARGETTHRLSGWGGTKPSRGPGSNTSRSVVSLNTLLRQRPDDVVVPLFDADMHIQTLINPDAFAASTTVDPFLAATMYLDQQCIERHEAEFKRWLNALVTIPDDLPEQPQTVDFGQLFHSVRHRDIGVAQTKEVVSANHFTQYRLDGLRRTAIALYTSDELSVPLAKLVVQIERKLIAIRDRDLHVDVVLQRQLLELLLGFNPLWLRLGLEITFGEQIAMRHSGDLMALSAFMVRRLFRDRHLDERTTALQKRQPEYAEGQRKFALKKVLTLFVFLDAAKRKRIVKHNPCLFVLGSELKDMRSVLMRFASSHIANLGDIQKDLRRIGIVLSHKQTYLDEFDYAFRNLAVDLRDGVRLSRLMEILLLRDDLMDRLRVPAISRLQRVHNVEVALGAWREADFVMSGGITGTDIADGHREKTLSLLWQLIYKFRSPKFHAAACTLQRWWRTAFLRVCIARRIRAKRVQRQTAAALVLQAAFRGQRDRRWCRAYAQRRHAAAVTLQAYTRRWLVLRRLHCENTCAVYVQRWYRATVQMRADRQRFDRLRRAVRTVQLTWRRRRFAARLERTALAIRRARAEERRRTEAAVLLQRRFREWQRTKADRAGFLRERDAAVRLQRWWRATSAMRLQRQRFGGLRVAAVTLQRRRRAQLAGRQTRTEYERLLRAVRSVQQRWRGLRLMRTTRADYAEQRSAATVLQVQFRARCTMLAQRAAYVRLRQSATLCQRRFRANRIGRAQRDRFARLRSATLVVQQRWRALLVMREQRDRFQQLRSAAVVLQQRFRARRQQRQQRHQFVAVRDACTTMQRRFRAQQAMRSASFDYQQLRTSAQWVQQRWRAQRTGRQQLARFQQQRTAAICIQQRFRATVEMRLQRGAFERLRGAAVAVQHRFRALLHMRVERAAYRTLLETTIVLQQRFRANRQCTIERTAFQLVRTVTITVQRRFRANRLASVQRIAYLGQRAACITIQQRFRAVRAMHRDQQQYQVLRTATVVIQQRWRALLCGRRLASKFQRLRQAAVCIQQRFRATRTMHLQQAAYQQLRRAAVQLQRRWRARRAMRQQHQSYQRLRDTVIRLQSLVRARRSARQQLAAYTQLRAAAVAVQRRWRALLCMRRQRITFQQWLRAVVTVQQRRRAVTQMRQQRARFVGLRAAAVCLQQRYRARRAMLADRQRFRQLRASTVVVQTRFRACRLAVRVQSDYLEYKLAVVQVQRRWRAIRTGRQQRSVYVRLRAAVACVQLHWRARRQMQACRTTFERQRSAVVCLQRRWRATLAMRAQRTRYTDTRRCVVRMQRLRRATSAMLVQRAHYERLRLAAVVVQRRFRALRLQRQVRQQFLLIRSLAVCVQRKFRARREMLRVREHFRCMRAAAIVLQGCWRRRQLMRRQQAGYRQLRAIALGLQTHARGWAARQRFADERPALEALVRRRRAVQLVQRVWRGFVVRRRCGRQMEAIRRQLREATGRAEPQLRLGHWVQSAVRLLNGRTNVNEVLRTLLRLVKVSRETPQVLIADAEFLCNFCYGIMAQAIRSEVDKQKIELCSCVILNLSRFDGTKEMALQSHGLVTVAQMLLRWCDKECGIFNTLCTVIYVQVQCSRMRGIIYEYMTQHDAIFMLRETKKMVIRKERMRANRAPNPLQPPLTAQQRVHRPLLQPDFGLRSASTTYVFNCSVFAFDTILHELDIVV